MKIFHLSDLHIGLTLGGYDLADIQRDILSQALEMIKAQQPDAILIAGDIYDKAAPSGEAFEIFDRFLTDLARLEPQIPVLIIAGNHDNAKRLSYAGNLLRSHQIYISTMPPQQPQDHLMHVTLQDDDGPVHFWLLPFFRPSYVRGLAREEQELELADYGEALSFILGREEIDHSQRNVLIAHQFFVNGSESPQRSDSELSALAVGGLDSIDVSLVKDFDYVALGHIHGPQPVGSDRVWYCGTPYKYSASEAGHEKALLVTELGPKGSMPVHQRIPFDLHPDVRKLKGTLGEVLAAGKDGAGDDFVSITLTDEEIYRPRVLLDEVFTRILDIQVDNARSRHLLEEVPMEDAEATPFEEFQDFYREMNGTEMDDDEEQMLKDIIDQVGNAQEE